MYEVVLQLVNWCRWGSARDVDGLIPLKREAQPKHAPVTVAQQKAPLLAPEPSPGRFVEKSRDSSIHFCWFSLIKQNLKSEIRWLGFFSLTEKSGTSLISD